MYGFEIGDEITLKRIPKVGETVYVETYGQCRRIAIPSKAFRKAMKEQNCTILVRSSIHGLIAYSKDGFIDAIIRGQLVSPTDEEVKGKVDHLSVCPN